MANAATVDKKDIVILKAMSPALQYVNMLLVVPPGEAPTKIRPTASSSRSPNILAKANAHKGINKYWEKKPINTAFGFLIALSKSTTVIVEPRPSPITKMNSIDRYWKIDMSTTSR